MATELSTFVDRVVLVNTNDGRILVGTLKGYDQTTNLILQDCHERVYSMHEKVTFVPLGLYLIRGDNIAVVGLVNEELDASVDYEQVRAEPLPPIQH